jgi:hypothetical protein
MNYFAIGGDLNKDITAFGKEHIVKVLFSADNDDVHLKNLPKHLQMLNRYKKAFFSEYQFSNMINYINHDNLIVCCDAETIDNDLLFYFYWNHIYNKKILPNEIVFQKISINPGIGSRLTNYNFGLFGCRIPMFLKLTNIINQYVFYQRHYLSGAGGTRKEHYDKIFDPAFDVFFIHQYLLKISAQVTANEKH